MTTEKIVLEKIYDSYRSEFYYKLQVVSEDYESLEESFESSSAEEILRAIGNALESGPAVLELKNWVIK